MQLSTKRIDKIVHVVELVGCTNGVVRTNRLRRGFFSRSRFGQNYPSWKTRLKLGKAPLSSLYPLWERAADVGDRRRAVVGLLSGWLGRPSLFSAILTRSGSWRRLIRRCRHEVSRPDARCDKMARIKAYILSHLAQYTSPFCLQAPDLRTSEYTKAKNAQHLFFRKPNRNFSQFDLSHTHVPKWPLESFSMITPRPAMG